MCKVHLAKLAKPSVQKFDAFHFLVNFACQKVIRTFECFLKTETRGDFIK